MIEEIQELKDLHNNSILISRAYERVRLLHVNNILSDKEYKKIKKILKQKEKMYSRHYYSLQRVVNEIQQKCSHKREDGSDAFEYEGHDSHRDYYVCEICGYERRI
jgi:rubrerythrin